MDQRRRTHISAEVPGHRQRDQTVAAQYEWHPLNGFEEGRVRSGRSSGRPAAERELDFHQKLRTGVGLLRSTEILDLDRLLPGCACPGTHRCPSPLEDRKGGGR